MVMSDYYQELAPWLLKPINRAHRLYLESHPELLSEKHRELLAQLVSEDRDLSGELRIRHELLRDILEYAGKQRDVRHSIRDAYVNKFGALMLDIPAKLAGIDEYLDVSSYIGWNKRRITECKLCLRNTILYARMECASAPEIIAEMNYCLARLFMQTTPLPSAQLQKRVLNYYEDAHDIYTYERYPLQYARVLEAIGDAYIWYPLTHKRENARIALKFYESASTIREKYASLP